MYRFKIDSSLRDYIITSGFPQGTFEIKELLTQMKEIIQTSKMYDPTNQAIILLDDCFAAALGADVLHVSEFQEQVTPHLEEVADKIKIIREQATIERVLSPDIQAICLPSLPLAGLLQHQEPIEYGKIMDQLSSYIIGNYDKLKTSNIRILKIGDDPILRAIFDVNYLHRCQVFSLLREHLTPCSSVLLATARIKIINSEKITLTSIQDPAKERGGHDL